LELQAGRGVQVKPAFSESPAPRAISCVLRVAPSPVEAGTGVVGHELRGDRLLKPGLSGPGASYQAMALLRRWLVNWEVGEAYIRYVCRRRPPLIEGVTFGKAPIVVYRADPSGIHGHIVAPTVPQGADELLDLDLGATGRRRHKAVGHIQHSGPFFAQV